MRPEGRTPVPVYVSYKNHEIHAAPEQLADNLKWTVSAHFWNYAHNGISARTYTASMLCDSREEALAHSVIYGRHLIDGKVPGVPAMH
jgi:hypothetical protein